MAAPAKPKPKRPTAPSSSAAAATQKALRQAPPMQPKTKPASWLTNPDGSMVDWRDPAQAAPKIVNEWHMEQWKQEVQPAEYIESRALTWIRELEGIGETALRDLGEKGPNYDLAAKIRLALIKLSSVNRQRVDMTAQLAMTAGPDLSGLSDHELRAIELGSHEQLNQLALRIGHFKSAKPEDK